MAWECVVPKQLSEPLGDGSISAASARRTSANRSATLAAYLAGPACCDMCSMMLCIALRGRRPWVDDGPCAV